MRTLALSSERGSVRAKGYGRSPATGLSGWSCCVVNRVLHKISRRGGGSPFGSQVYEGNEQEDGWLIPVTNKDRFTGNRNVITAGEGRAVTSGRSLALRAHLPLTSDIPVHSTRGNPLIHRSVSGDPHVLLPVVVEITTSLQART